MLLVGISGPSSSGKTTLARLIRDIFPPSLVFILHLDDFYLTDASIPIKDGIQDWDCMESLNLPELKSTLLYIKEHGKSPPSFVSKEDQNSVGENGIDTQIIAELRKEVKDLVIRVGWTTPIAIVEGFLLFSNNMKGIHELFDLKLFLRTSYETAKRRREARSGYVTLEGFWEDPPGYVDRVVWPNYVKDHKFLFEGGDVQGRLDEDVCSKIGLLAMPRAAEESMTKCLNWAIKVLEDAIRQQSQSTC